MKNARMVITVAWMISLVIIVLSIVEHSRPTLISITLKIYPQILVLAAFVIACIATNKLTRGGQS